jgi:hypothetical protein
MGTSMIEKTDNVLSRFLIWVSCTPLEIMS